MSDDRLRLLIERIERINEEIAGLRDDRKDVFAEAKAMGYDAAIIRKVIARRGMPPEARQEADAMLDLYEAALGGHGPDVPVSDAAERAAALAQDLLAEQIAGLEDPETAARVVEHVTALIDLRAEVAELRRQEGDRRKLAKAEGLQVAQLGLVVRWLEKCAKHGPDAMRAGEAVYLMYRATVENRPEAAAPTADPVLAAKFAAPKPKKITARDRRLAETMLWAGSRGEDK